MPAETEAKMTRGPTPWPTSPPEFSRLAVPERLFVPVSIKTGGNAKAPGTKVRRGESLVESPAESSHIPLAPVAGTLGDVHPIRLTTGRLAAGVELIPSGNANEESPPLKSSNKTDNPFLLLSGLELLRAAGVWADRHISPDLIGQLNQIISRPIDTLICTILDSDASLRLHAAIAAQMADRVVAGVSFLSGITAARRAIIAVESFTSPKWIAPLAAAARPEQIQIVELANDYPQSDPVLMMYTLTRRRARPGSLPTAHAALVLDAAAALAVGDAAAGRPMLTVPVAVHEHVPRRSHFFLVPVGATVEALLRQLWIEPEDVILRGGDLLRDLRLTPDSVIAGGELSIHITARERPVIPEPCIRCAWCIEACPTRVHPALVLDAAQRADTHMANRAGIAACIECGICEHVCPSRLPLLDAIREMRNSRAV